uniref:Transposase n=1 Tax=Globodera rostochiensis TaxID=31243 RepID=A0A914I7H6_GLORO
MDKCGPSKLSSRVWWKSTRPIDRDQLTAASPPARPPIDFKWALTLWLDESTWLAPANKVSSPTVNYCKQKLLLDGMDEFRSRTAPAVSDELNDKQYN